MSDPPHLCAAPRTQAPIVRPVSHAHDAARARAAWLRRPYHTDTSRLPIRGRSTWAPVSTSTRSTMPRSSADPPVRTVEPSSRCRSARSPAMATRRQPPVPRRSVPEGLNPDAPRGLRGQSGSANLASCPERLRSIHYATNDRWTTLRRQTPPARSALVSDVPASAISWRCNPWMRACWTMVRGRSRSSVHKKLRRGTYQCGMQWSIYQPQPWRSLSAPYRSKPSSKSSPSRPFHVIRCSDSIAGLRATYAVSCSGRRTGRGQATASLRRPALWRYAICTMHAARCTMHRPL